MVFYILVTKAYALYNVTKWGLYPTVSIPATISNTTLHYEPFEINPPLWAGSTCLACESSILFSETIY